MAAPEHHPHGQFIGQKTYYIVDDFTGPWKEAEKVLIQVTI